ncbi:hypothetical protein Poly51_05670 [Rubripirellula tenax]|uniref:Exostosin family protein n=2 Tax=Rubripirellula tenax TaxID=2528015 RepID=A0A5C6FL13_9BACT|nr:hypothetical protein Poly51_05670 [Rubripirellula tenax]
MPQGLNERRIALVLRTDRLLIDAGRHLATIAHHAMDAGSPVTLVCPKTLLAAIAHKPYGRAMLAMPGVEYANDSTALPHDALLLCDDPHEARSNAKGVYLKIGRDVDRDAAVMPYPMHPSTLKRIGPTTLRDLRHHRRWISILFAGNQKPRYGDDKIRRDFGILNRLEVLETVRAAAADRIVDRMDLADATRNMVLSDSRTDPVSASNWLPALASADFFLCCPGSAQPTCHHLVEAMSVGTIPILEYGDRVTPELSDGINAICFSGAGGLADAIGRIDALTDDVIATMRSAAATFYDDQLCGARFLRNLRDDQRETRVREISLPFHNKNFVDAATTVARAA